MRFVTEVERSVVSDFIKKDKTIRCPIKGDFYAMLDSDTGAVISALCITNHLSDCGHYRINGMRTAKENRKNGFSTQVLSYALRQPKYSGHVIHANALSYSKHIFERLGFHMIEIANVAGHDEYRFERVIGDGSTEERD